MSLVFNGVIIPTNVANAVTFNSGDINKVFMNGVEVWKQSLGPIVGWSGSSISASIGFETSGFNFRYMNTFVGAGSWLTALSDGTFTNGSSTIGGGGGTAGTTGFFSGGAYNTAVDGIKYATDYDADGFVSWLDGSFTGSSIITGGSSLGYGLETSGGQIRFKDGGGAYSWITLT